MIESISNGADLKRARRQRPAPQIDRLPPSSPESEQAILSCILNDPDTSISQCITEFPEGGSVFYDLRHTTIFETCVSMWDQKIPIDIITLQDRLKQDDMLEVVGGLSYLMELPNVSPSSANLPFYLSTVQEKYLLRKAIQTATNVVSVSYESSGTFDEVMDTVEAGLQQLSRAKSATGVTPIKAAIAEATQVFESYLENKGAITGIETGFIDFDRLTSGLQKSDVIIIAARPSVGKTSLAMNIAENVAAKNKIPVGVFSMEMSTQSLVVRMICSRARVNLRNLREGFMAERDFPRLTAAMGALSSAPLWIDDTPALSVLQMRTKMRRMVQQFAIKLFVVDYLQLMRSGSRGKDGRQQEVSDISAGIKAIAKELGVPIIVLSQLNRDVEKDKKRKPRLSDIRESGAIEQDADLVGLLYRAVQGEEEEENDEQDAIPVNLLIAKQRNGPTGEIPLTFIRSLTRFESAARVSDDDYQGGSSATESQTEFTEPEP